MSSAAIVTGVDAGAGTTAITGDRLTATGVAVNAPGDAEIAYAGDDGTPCPITAAEPRDLDAVIGVVAVAV